VEAGEAPLMLVQMIPKSRARPRWKQPSLGLQKLQSFPWLKWLSGCPTQFIGVIWLMTGLPGHMAVQSITASQ
jgi:hypothetical protein